MMHIIIHFMAVVHMLRGGVRRTPSRLTLQVKSVAWDLKETLRNVFSSLSNISHRIWNTDVLLFRHSQVESRREAPPSVLTPGWDYNSAHDFLCPCGLGDRLELDGHCMKLWPSMCRGSREGGRHMFFCRVGHHLRLVTHLKTKNYSSCLKQTWRRIHPSQIVCKYKPQKKSAPRAGAGAESELRGNVHFPLGRLSLHCHIHGWDFSSPLG